MVHDVVRSMVLRICLRSRMWYMHDLDTAEIWSERVRILSKMTPRLRAESAGERMIIINMVNWMISWMIKLFELFWETNDEKFSFWRIEGKLDDIQLLTLVTQFVQDEQYCVRSQSREWYIELSVINTELMTWKWIRYDFTERNNILEWIVGNQE